MPDPIIKRSVYKFNPNTYEGVSAHLRVAEYLGDQVGVDVRSYDRRTSYYVRFGGLSQDRDSYIEELWYTPYGAMYGVLLYSSPEHIVDEMKMTVVDYLESVKDLT